MRLLHIINFNNLLVIAGYILLKFMLFNTKKNQIDQKLR